MAAILTFNPDLQRLRENITAISPQVGKVLIVDNHSCNIEGVLRVANEFANSFVIRNDENVGVARALNQEAQYAVGHGYEWLLHLDQDTVVADTLIETYIQYVDDPSLGIICCQVKDRNVVEPPELTRNQLMEANVSTCITSGTFLRLAAWQKTAGYCDEMFIDWVDNDFCYSLQEVGYKIFKTRKTFILHEVGNSRLVKSFGKYRYVYNEKPFRHYYSIRNYIYVQKRHWAFLSQNRTSYFLTCLYVLLKKIFFVNVHETDRVAKNHMMVKGIWHGIVNRYGKLA